MSIRNREAFTLVEMVIAMGLFMLLVAPVFGLFVVSKQSAHFDESVTDTQEKTRSSLELIARQIKNLTSINEALDDTPGRSRIDFTSVEDMGAVESPLPLGGLLNDSDKAWDTNIWIGATVKIIYGTGKDQERAVLANSSNYLVVNPSWTTIPDNTSVYEIRVRQRFYVDHTVDPSELIYSRVLSDPMGGSPVFNDQPFGRNITGLTLVGYDQDGIPTTIANRIASLDVQVLAQSEMGRKGEPDSRFEYSVSNTVKLRNSLVEPEP